tara:strand:- start:108 stop:458 length:351 start_codon:yes stop_codon:yes gene_type:complete
MIPNYDAIIKKAKSLCDDKNTDYAQTEEPFSNFEMVEALKICDTSTGILVRISDKIARISNLLKRNGERAIAEEKVEDTMLDLINYSVILLSYYMYEQEYKMYTNSENGEKNDTSR